MIYPPIILLISIISTILPNHASAQLPTQPNFFNSWCSNSTGNYTTNSLYDTNLKAVLSDLVAHASANLSSYGTSVGVATSSPVYGVYYCRGDISPNLCSDCVKATTYNASARGECFTNMDGVICFHYPPSPIAPPQSEISNPQSEISNPPPSSPSKPQSNAQSPTPPPSSISLAINHSDWVREAIDAHYLRSVKGFWFDVFVILPIRQRHPLRRRPSRIVSLPVINISDIHLSTDSRCSPASTSTGSTAPPSTTGSTPPLLSSRGNVDLLLVYVTSVSTSLSHSTSIQFRHPSTAPPSTTESIEKPNCWTASSTSIFAVLKIVGC